MIIVLLLILAIKKRWRTFFHGIALAGFTGGGIVLFKNLTHIIRPWGITSSPETFSFPSGHTTFATSFYIGLALMLAEATRLRKKTWLYVLVGSIILAISISRLYLGAHWFTDILGGCRDLHKFRCQKTMPCYERCRTSISARKRACNAEHRTEITQKQRAYNADHRSEITANHRAYYAEHRTEIVAKKSIQ